MTLHVLTPADLRATCRPEDMGFDTTAALAPLDGLFGQERAVEAIRLAARIRNPRFNLYVLGPEGSGRHSGLRALLQQEAKGRPVPPDWVYVQNFATPDHPRALRLPQGKGPKLRAAMQRLVEDLAGQIPAMLASEDHQNRRMALEQSFTQGREQAFEALRAAAEARGVAILRTPMGFSLAPMLHGEVLKPEAIKRLDQAERDRMEQDVAATREDLESFLLAGPEIARDQRAALADLDAQVARTAVDAALKRAIRGFERIPGIRDWFDALRGDLIAHADLFLSLEMRRAETPFAAGSAILREDPRFHRYGVNVVVSHPPRSKAAPVIEETLPTLANLSGQIDYVSQQGTLITDFTLIKPGALHRANGGFLILDARRVLTEPFAWDGLKRCLETRSIRMTTPAERLGLIATTTLEPEPIPLEIRVVLVGDAFLHAALSELDPDFSQHFQVLAEFAPDVPRDEARIALFARAIAAVVRDEGLRPVAADGVAALVEASSRDAGDRDRLSLRLGTTLDLLREADHIAAGAGDAVTGAAHVTAAIRAGQDRRGLTRDRLQEMIAQGTILISTGGATVGQVNALTVTEIGQTRFGLPARVTARVRVGSGRVVDIEREARLGGPIHSKAVLILTAFLSARYVPETPLSLWASLVFEQSYGGVEGDSASLAEVCALLSAIAGVPVSQSFAVTGSINQLGEVQPVGGINEKIEGFFDVCAAQGLTGRQGVIIPAANRRNLMLRADVIEAVAAGRFHIHAVTHVDDAIEQLTGLPAGARQLNGEFPDGSLNGNVEVRLLDFAETQAALRTPVVEAPAGPPEDEG